MISNWHEDFQKFFNYLLIFAFLVMFWQGLKVDAIKGNDTKTYVSAPIPKIQTSTQQPVYRRVYVNNNFGGPATVYYVR